MWSTRVGGLLILTPLALASPLYYWAMNYAGGWFVDTDLPPDHRAIHLLETYWLLMLMITCLTCKWQPKIRAPGGEDWQLKSSAHRCAAGEICEDGGDSRYLSQVHTEAQECMLTWINGPKSVAEC